MKKLTKPTNKELVDTINSLIDVVKDLRLIATSEWGSHEAHKRLEKLLKDKENETNNHN